MREQNGRYTDRDGLYTEQKGIYKDESRLTPRDRKTLMIVVIVMLIILVHFAFKAYSSSRAEAAPKPSLDITFLKVGKADAMILKSGDEAMVIDTGEKEDGDEILEKLRDAGVSRLRALVITHYDKDHVGGADTVVKGIDIDSVYLPDYEGSGGRFKKFMEAVKEERIEPLYLREPVSFTLGTCEVDIEPPLSYEISADMEEEYDNDLSLITSVKCGERSFLLTGDAEERRLREWMGARKTATHYDVVKLPHHGRYDPALSDFLKFTTPRFAIMCTSKKNPADESVLNLLYNDGITGYETREGDIIIRCDGTSLNFDR